MSKPDVVAALEARGVKHVKVGGFDIDGVLRGKYMSLDKLASALESGFGFCDVIFGWDVADTLYDEASVTGWERGFPDALAIIDPQTERDLPWEPHTALFVADFRTDTGDPHPACPRSLLRAMRDRALAMGFEAKFSAEYEFFFFKETPDSLAEKGYVGLDTLTPGMFGYSVLRSGQNRELMADILDHMAAFEVPIEGLHTETGPGVYEAAIHYDEVLASADRAALFKVGLKQIAREHGISVTFMAKWNASLPGTSGHLHQSLWQGGKNAFATDGEMSDVMRHYVGGLCKLIPAMTAMVSPTVNSYKRYVPGVWAPLTASWGVENRTTAVRLIGRDAKTGKWGKGSRIEFRQTAADMNPYVAMAACLGAGLHGIEQAIEPPPEAKGDASEIGEPVPRSLGAAAEALAASETARTIFGSAFVDHYVHTRRWEQAQYDKAVTDWELRRYFEVV
ncbi:MAG: glutamine synthetase [Myxococcales bacterium]|nr:glutamine synthetase [Myxococcales bacterium]